MPMHELSNIKTLSKNVGRIISSSENKVRNLKSKMILIRKIARTFFHRLVYTRSGNIFSVFLFFLAYAAFKYCTAYIEIICDKKHTTNLKILRHLKPRLKKYNPTLYMFHPMLTIFTGDMKLNSNFIVKFSSQVTIYF